MKRHVLCTHGKNFNLTPCKPSEVKSTKCKFLDENFDLWVSKLEKVPNPYLDSGIGIIMIKIFEF